MAKVTKFLMTDETGQSIAAAINAINPNDAVRYSAQTLTDAQKAQARSNIGAISEDEVDVSTKADKVVGATSGHLAGLDSNGNLTDSTIPASDVTGIKNDLIELRDEVGINIWDEEWANGYWDEGNQGKFVPYAGSFACKNLIKVIPNVEYYINKSQSLYVLFYDLDKNYISYTRTQTFTTPNNCGYITFYMNSYGTTYNHDICINVSNPSINGTYYPFRGLRKDIKQLSNETLDIKMLGWSVPKECPIQNYMDADRKFHQRVGRIRLKDLSWYTVSVGSNPVFEGRGITPSGKHNPTSTIPNYYLNKYSALPFSNRGSIADKQFYCGFDTGAVRIRDDSYSSVSAFTASLTDSDYLYYELATEIVTNVDGNEAINPFFNYSNIETVSSLTGLDGNQYTQHTITKTGICIVTGVNSAANAAVRFFETTAAYQGQGNQASWIFPVHKGQTIETRMTAVNVYVMF